MADEMPPSQTKVLRTRSGISFTIGIVPHTMRTGTHSQRSKLELNIKQKVMAMTRFTPQAHMSEWLLVTAQSFTSCDSNRASSNPMPNGSMPPTKL